MDTYGAESDNAMTENRTTELVVGLAVAVIAGFAIGLALFGRWIPEWQYILEHLK